MDLAAVRAALIAAPGAVLVARSCSGDALWAVFAGPKAESVQAYKANWEAMAAGFPPIARAANSAASKNLNRLRFLAFDPDAWMAPGLVVPLPGAPNLVNAPPEAHRTGEKAVETAPDAPTPTPARKTAGNAPGGKSYPTEALEHLVARGEFDHDDVRVAIGGALKNEGHGYADWADLCARGGSDDPTHYEESRFSSFDPPAAAGYGSIVNLAKDRGWTPGASRAGNQTGGAAHTDGAPATVLFDWGWVNLAELGDLPPVVQRVPGVVIEGNITLLYAPPQVREEPVPAAPGEGPQPRRASLLRHGPGGRPGPDILRRGPHRRRGAGEGAGD